jgi:4-carboxymuconolactone decarboxylase
LRPSGGTRYRVQAIAHSTEPGEGKGEVLLHTAVYAGVPAANAAFAMAERVLEDEGAAEAGRDGAG